MNREHGEFSLIRRYFQHTPVQHPETRLGNGDDASLHHVPPGQELVVSTDSALQGRHWPEDFPLSWAAERAFSAALSDLAAMGARPCWAWICANLHRAEDAPAIAEGLRRAAEKHMVEIAGGDTTRGSCCSLHITVAGFCEAGSAMRRDHARSGERLFLVGDVGLASAGLRQWQMGCRDGEFVHFFRNIQPRIDIGRTLLQAGVRCAIDVSDGLLQDAGHIAQASDCDIELDVSLLPSLPRLQGHFGEEQGLRLALSGGEDYALLFSAPDNLRPRLPPQAIPIGWCHPPRAPGAGSVRAYHHDGQPVHPISSGFDHFSS